MAKIKFSTIVKYDGKFIDAHTPFEVDDEQVAELVSGGAIVLDKPKAASRKEKAEAKAAAEADDKVPDNVPDPEAK